MDCPGERDILCGDVNAFFDHLGNRRFRKLIDLHIEDYLADATLRESLIKDIVRALKRSQYRILTFNKSGAFEEVGDDAEITRTVSYDSRLDWVSMRLSVRAHSAGNPNTNLSIHFHHCRSAHPYCIVWDSFLSTAIYISRVFVRSIVRALTL